MTDSTIQTQPFARASEWLKLCVGTVLLLVVLLAIAYPGTMTPDSEGSLDQCRSGHWIDLKPIGNILLWCLGESFWPGPLGVVAINITLLVVSLVSLIFIITRSAVAASVATTIVLFYPPVLSQLPIAWRDQTGLGITLALMAVAILMLQHRLNSGRVDTRVVCLLIASIALNYIGALLRTNHAAGALAIVIAGGVALLPTNLYLPRICKSLAVVTGSTGLLILTTLAAMYTSSAVSQKRLHVQAVYNFNLGLISDSVDRNLYPPDLFPEIDLAIIRKLVAEGPRAYGKVFWSAYIQDSIPTLPRLHRTEEVEQLSQAHWSAIRQFPLTFARIKATYAIAYFVPTTRYSGPYPLNRDVSEDLRQSSSLNWPVERPRWSRVLLDYLFAVQVESTLFRSPMPVLFLALAGSGIGYLFRMQHWLVMLMACGSAWGHLFSIALTIPTPQLRLAHHSIVMGLLCLAIFIISVLHTLWYKRERASKTVR